MAAGSQASSRPAALSAATPGAQGLDFIGRRLALCVTGQPLLAGLQKLLRPAIVEILVDLLPAAQLRDALLAAKPLQHHPDLLLRGILSPGRPADRLDRFLSAAVGMVFLCSHRFLLSDDDELNLSLI